MDTFPLSTPSDRPECVVCDNPVEEGRELCDVCEERYVDAGDFRLDPDMSELGGFLW